MDPMWVLPGFIHAAGTTKVRLYDGKGEQQQTARNLCGRSRASWKVELHKYAYKFDDAYTSVWNKFCEATGVSGFDANGRWRVQSAASIRHASPPIDLSTLAPTPVPDGPVPEVPASAAGPVDGFPGATGEWPRLLEGVAPLKSYEMQGIAVTTTDVAKLLPGQWVNDEVVNYFLHRLWWAISETRPALSCRIGVFQSFAFGQLTRVWGESGDLPGDYISQYAASKPAHLIGYCAETFWDCDVLLFPVNKEDKHWTLLIVCNPGKSDCCMVHLDSLSKTQSEQSTFASSLVRGFLTAEWERAKRGEGPDFSKVPCFHESVPPQDNGNDCGPFLCYFAEHVVSILSDMPTTEQLDIENFRAAVRKIDKPNMVQYRFDLMAFFFSTIVVRYTQPSRIESLQACIDAAKAACQGFPSHPTMWSTLPVPPKRVPVKRKRGRSGAAPALWERILLKCPLNAP